MQPIIARLEDWQRQGKVAALATVVRVTGSAPRPLGARMAVSASGEMMGSVSGGCVEGAVVQEALAVLETGRARLCAYGIDDGWAQSAGLACGGQIEVFIAPWRGLPGAWDGEAVVAWATVLTGVQAGQQMLVGADGRLMGSLQSSALTAAVQQAAMPLLTRLQTQRCSLALGESTVEVFIEVLAPPPHLVIIGAVHIAMALVEFARRLGFHTTVIDPRPIFATRLRFPHADHILQQWPDAALAEIKLHANTYVVVISHDDKLDIPALVIACRHQPRYIGVMGSRHTMQQRLQALHEQGLTETQLARLKNPIGLDIGAATPEEIALAIMAEVVAVRRGTG